MPWPPGLSCWDDSGTPAVVVTVGDLMSRSAKALVVLVPPGGPVVTGGDLMSRSAKALAVLLSLRAAQW